MSDDLVKQAIAELADVVRCRCNEAYKGRGLHDPDCQCDSAEAVKVVADRIEELEAKLAKAVEDLQSMPEAVAHTALDDGPLWPEDRIGVWLVALHTCKNVVQSKVDQTLKELKGQDDD